LKGVDSHLSTGPTLRHDKKGCVDLGHSEAHRFRKHGFMVWVALDGRLRPVVFPQATMEQYYVVL
jgi:hypothetical protein